MKIARLATAIVSCLLFSQTARAANTLSLSCNGCRIGFPSSVNLLVAVFADPPISGNVDVTLSITGPATANPAMLSVSLSSGGTSGWGTSQLTPSAPGIVTVIASANGFPSATSVITFVDVVKPSINITSPANGAMVSGSGFSVIGSAADDVAISKVEVQIENGAFNLASGLASWSYSVGALPAGSHTITAKATDTGGNAQTTSISVSVPPPPCTLPAAPSNLVAVAVNCSQINLSWVDNAGDESGFFIQRNDGSGWINLPNLGSNVTSFSDPNLKASTTYTYAVRAFNPCGNSAFSNQAQATTGASLGKSRKCK